MAKPGDDIMTQLQNAMVGSATDIMTKLHDAVARSAAAERMREAARFYDQLSPAPRSKKAPRPALTLLADKPVKKKKPKPKAERPLKVRLLYCEKYFSKRGRVANLAAISVRLKVSQTTLKKYARLDPQIKAILDRMRGL